jgi:hypothetical protein
MTCVETLQRSHDPSGCDLNHIRVTIVRVTIVLFTTAE